MGRISSHLDSDERYPALRIAGMALTMIGALLLLAGVLLLGFGLTSLGAGPPAESPRGGAPLPFPQRTTVLLPAGGARGGLAVLASLGFLVSGVQFLAMGALVGVAIHVEENTRATAQCLERVASRLEAADPVAGPRFVS